MVEWDAPLLDAYPKTVHVFSMKAKGRIVLTSERIYLHSRRSYPLRIRWVDNLVLAGMDAREGCLILRYHFASLPFRVVLAPYPPSMHPTIVALITRDLRTPFSHPSSK